jgi:murein DD-endopeptidase MepM/ murein hydrolase activator NlpD
MSINAPGRKTIATLTIGLTIGLGIILFGAYTSNRSLGQSASAALCEEDKALARNEQFVLSVVNHQNERDEYFYDVSVQSRAKLPLFIFFGKPSSLPMPAPAILQATPDRSIDLVTEPSTNRAINFGMMRSSSSYIEAEEERVQLMTRVVGRFPVLGASQIIQTPERMTTHAGDISAEQAIDIAAPRGSVVAAFQPGTVHYVQDGYHDDNSCGEEHAERYTNVIKIYQDDGLEAIYAHLKQSSILVQEGDRVEAGQALAQVGCYNTCRNSHLHFSVQTLTVSGLQSIPVNFYYDDPAEAWVPKLNEQVTYGLER